MAKIKVPNSYDVVGSIAILKFEDAKLKEKKKIAKKLLNERKNIKTVVEKKEKIKGRLRTLNTRHLAGKKTTETIHVESGCKFKVDIEDCYFSPRLSNERLEIARKINKMRKKKKKVLVMFSGVAPYPIIIAKYAKPKKVYSVELGRKCSKYAKENIKLNRVNVKHIQGDVKKVLPKLKEKFDVIVMPRPRLKNTFLQQAFSVSRKNTRIIYYGFGKNIENIKEKIKNEASIFSKKIKGKTRTKIRFLEEDTAGNIAPYKFRYRIIFKIV